MGARICQDNGLVPIVEPEILLDGDRDIATTARVQERVLSTVYMKLQDNGVLLEGSLLKPSMTVPGIDCPDKSDPATIAKMTVQTLDRGLREAMGWQGGELQGRPGPALRAGQGQLGGVAWQVRTWLAALRRGVALCQGLRLLVRLG